MLCMYVLILIIHLNWSVYVLTVVCQSENYGIQTKQTYFIDT